MIEFTEDFDNAPYKELGISIFDLFNLQTLLSPEDFEKSQNIKDVKERVLFIANTLNNSKMLPKRYKQLVKKYNPMELVEPLFRDIQY